MAAVAGTAVAEASAVSHATYRLAVASKEGQRINVHLGHVTKFYVYDVAHGNVCFVAERDVGLSDPEARRTPMSDIVDALTDCGAVFVSKIGGNRRGVLQNRGIESVVEYAHQEIEQALLGYVQVRVSALWGVPLLPDY